VTDLPGDDPNIVKLLIVFLYENDYTTTLPEASYTSSNGLWILKEQRLLGHSYDFPHTCLPGCPNPSRAICPHHYCAYDACRYNCSKFICEECTSPQPCYDDASQLLLHAKMYEVADKYDMSGLKGLAAEKFARACRKYYKNEEFAVAAEHALTTTPDSDSGLREILLETMASHPELFDDAEVEALLGRHTDFAFGLLKRQAAEIARRKAA
jgi:hypothetical protein